MKIVFCVTLLCVAAVSVSSAQSEELNGVVGNAVSFPPAVTNAGSLTYRDTVIGDVTGSKFTLPPNNFNEKFKKRVQWDSSTGHFSITGLKMEDSGLYKVSDDSNQEKLFKLTVYVPVSKPIVSHDKDSCTINCTVDRGTEVTLHWKRDADKKILGTSGPLNTQMKLSVPVERSGTYTCEAKNNVSRERNSVTVGKECAGGAAVNWQTEGSKIWMACLAVIVMWYSFLV